jgi:hypothetical protein
MCEVAYMPYVDEGEYTEIDGWNEYGAFMALRLIDAYQKKNDIHGSMVEIGVHHGQFLIGMALMRGMRGMCVAVDIFDQQELNLDKSGYGDRKAFIDNLKKYDLEHDVCMIPMSSLQVLPETILHYDPEGSRIFHIDGGHTVAHIANDLALAERVCQPAGVVIIDDFLHPGWFGVTEGICRYFLQIAHNFILFPFAYGNNKLYLTRFEWREKYKKLFGEAFDGCEKKLTNFFGFDVYWVDYQHGGYDE